MQHLKYNLKNGNLKRGVHLNLDGSDTIEVRSTCGTKCGNNLSDFGVYWPLNLFKTLPTIRFE